MYGIEKIPENKTIIAKNVFYDKFEYFGYNFNSTKIILIDLN